MLISVTPLPLELRHPFRIAHGTSTIRHNALVQIGAGYGEAALPPYYPTTFDEVEDYVSSNADLITACVSDPDFSITTLIDSLPFGPTPALAAIDMALHDLFGQRLNAPLFKIFGLDPNRIPHSTYALPIPTSLNHLDEQLDDVIHFPFLKLKIGSGDVEFDKAIVRHTRERFAGRLCVDVNSGWSIDMAIHAIKDLQDCNLEFVEQPIQADDIDDWHLLKRLLPDGGPPLIADESVQGPDQILELAGAADGINIKLAKCGGIQVARQMISLARSLDLSVMLGCMIESSVALTAAAHLGALVDYLDLDGQLHLAQDPFEGLTFDAGKIRLPKRPGLGVRPRST